MRITDDGVGDCVPSFRSSCLQTFLPVALFNVAELGTEIHELFHGNVSKAVLLEEAFDGAAWFRQPAQQMVA